MRVVQCSWEEMQKEQRLFCEPHRMAFKNNGHFFKNDGHFFSIFREEERKKRKNGGLKRNKKRKILFDISLITRKSLPLQHTICNHYSPACWKTSILA